MLLLFTAYLGGVLTILSPCILPVLPFVFARADRPFRSHGLPLLLGMAVAFTAIATLAAVGGGWVVTVNEYGRCAAIALLALFGVTLLLPSVADRMSRPLVALGIRLAEARPDGRDAKASMLSPLLLGLAAFASAVTGRPQALIFTRLAVVYFALVLPVNHLKKVAFERVKNDEEQTPQDVPPTDVEVLLEIRDLLRSQNGVPTSTGSGAHVAPSTAPEGPGIGGTTKL